MRDSLVSCLCVTEGRPVFMPWLLWCFDRQCWPWRELVIVDSSPEPFRVEGRDDVRVVTAAPGTGVAGKRNLALQAARGEFITWFDDDDWQHPAKLERLVEALSGDAVYAGAYSAWFVDLLQLRCRVYRGPRQQFLFNSAGFRRAAIVAHRFRENLRHASDTPWMQGLAQRYPTQSVLLEHEDMFFWLCHQDNLSNPAKHKHCAQRIQVLKESIGEQAWGDTDAALEELRARLQDASGSATPTPIEITDDKPYSALVADAPPVGLMIKATVMEAPFLEHMVKHMVTLARYPFAERALIVDRQPALTGKYRTRPRATPAELNRILERLLADGIVDHVRTVDTSPSLFAQIMERYFSDDAAGIQAHATTGGPIYPTLFGLESMSTDFVLQMDADIFFHSGPESWVAQALAAMAADPRLWLMMTHPGPPCGPPGKSLGARNARRAVWDPESAIWRFDHATTRYFLCDRRQLHHRLCRLAVGPGCAPLEQCISAALQRHGAFRGALGNLESWHLHAWYHGAPFPQWASALAQAITAGRFPALQRGDYDLRLDRTRDRNAWAEVLRSAPRAVAVTASGARVVVTDDNDSYRATGDNGSSRVAGKLADTVPLTVVIPVRNRAGRRLRNALASLNWQSAGKPLQLLVVSHGSDGAIERELADLCAEAGACLMTVGTSAEPWNKPLALNSGIRAVSDDIPYVMTMDADMILAPDFFAVLLARLAQEPPALVLCRISDLPQQTSLPNEPDGLRQAFGRLQNLTHLRPRYGTGGIQAAPRSFFFDIRGYDEDLLWWGAMDGDMVNRAVLGGLAIEWIEDRTAMLHQWHPRKHQVLTSPDEAEQARRAWRYNHVLVRSRSTTLRRNPGGWGGGN